MSPTSASTTAASGARPTTAPTGSRSSTQPAPARSARSRWPHRIRTSSTSAPAPGSSDPTSPPGDGVYKSTDGGKTWTHLGLCDTQMIAMIDVDPKDPNRLFVAALGHPYGPNAERGIFRSTDGGKTFQKVLYKDEYTSGNDVRIDPTNSQHRLRGALAAAGELHRERRLRRRRAKATGSSSPPTAAPRGRSSPTDCRPVIQANLAISASNPRAIYAMVAGTSVPGGGGRGRAAASASTSRLDAGEHWHLARQRRCRTGRGRRARPTTGRSAGSAAATCRPSRSTRRTSRRSTARRRCSGAPRMAASPGRRCAARRAVMTTRRPGSTRSTRTSCSSWPIRARWSRPIAASRGATGTPSRPRRCITSRPTTPSPTGSAAASRIPARPASRAARWTARSPSTTGIR